MKEPVENNFKQTYEKKQPKPDKSDKTKVLPSQKSTIEQKNITEPLQNQDFSSDKKKITNNDHLKFLNNLGSGHSDGAKFRTNYTRKMKRRTGIGKKSANAAEEESEDEGLNKDDDKHQQQFELIQESNEEYKRLKARADAGEQISKKQLFLARPPSNTIILCYGPIPGRQPTVFFNYPPFLKMQRPYKPDQI